MLQERLKEAPDKDSFLNLVVDLGREKGYSFTSEELEVMLGESSQGLGELPADKMEVDRFHGFIKDVY